MPLFVPVIISAAAIIASGYGGKEGYKGITAMRRAKAIGEEVERRHRDHLTRLEVARAQLAEKLEETRALQIAIARTTLGRMVELLRALERREHLRTPTAIAQTGVLPEQVQAFVVQHREGGGLGDDTGSAEGAGAGADAQPGLFGSLETPCMGADFSSLSEAAAQSAILGWIGARSLAAGGGRIAAGALRFGGIAAAPTIAIGGLVLAAEGEKALTKIMEYSAEVDKATARIDILVALHRGAERRAGELQGLMMKLEGRVSTRMEEIMGKVDLFDEENDDDAKRLSTVMVLCKALSELLHARVIDENGQLDQASEALIARYRFLGGDA